jgi:hypothetical protein
MYRINKDTVTSNDQRHLLLTFSDAKRAASPIGMNTTAMSRKIVTTCVSTFKELISWRAKGRMYV